MGDPKLTDDPAVPDTEHQLHVLPPLSESTGNMSSKNIERFIDPASENRLVKLRHAGDDSWSRYEHLSELGDINTSINFRTRVVALLPEGHPDRPKDLDNLGSSLRMRFERLGDLVDLEDAIKHQREAISLVSDNHPDKPSLLESLGASLGRRFERLRNIADIDEALEYHQRADALTIDDHPAKPRILNSLGLSYRRRFGRSGNLADLSLAIQCQQAALTLACDGHTERPSILNNLGNSLGRRFERLGNPEDINKAIGYQQEAISLTPVKHIKRTGFLNNLGNSLMRRFQRLGDLADADKAIECQKQAVLTMSNDYAEKTRSLNNLAVSLLGRFERLGNVTDINRAIEYQKQSVGLRPNDSEKSGPLDNLGILLQQRFLRLGNLEDIDRAIEYQREAVSLAPEDHTQKFRVLGHLGASLLRRYSRLYNLPDVEEAIVLVQKAVSLVPNGHPEKPIHINTLGHLFLCRFEVLDSPDDIDKAVELHQQAVSLRSDGDAWKPKYLDNLGIALWYRFQLSDKLADIQQAIECQQSAVSLTPEDHSLMPTYLSNLGRSLSCRFDYLKNQEDINMAMNCQERAINLTPKDSITLPQLYLLWGFFAEGHFRHSKDRAVLDKALDCYKRAAFSVGPAQHRLMATRKWNSLYAEQHGFPSLEASEIGMMLIPYVVWLGRTVQSRYEDTSRVGGVTTEAVAAAIGSRKYERALEWLEEGRSIVWGQLLQLRTPVEELRAADSKLADRLQVVARDLQVFGTKKEGLKSPSHDATIPEISSHVHHRLAEEWEKLVIKARLIPGFKNFLLPKKAGELLSAAQSGSVVAVNVYDGRCDALVLHPHSSTITHVPLPSFSYEKATKAQIDWTNNLQQYGVRDRGFKRQNAPERSRAKFEEVLAILWTDVVEPVLRHLGYLRIQPEDQLPHVTWCTTGPLAFLPIHAAGCYGKTGLQPKIFDYVVSSYTPTISALLAQAKRPDDFSGMLAVSQEVTPGLLNLPCANGELDKIQEAAGQIQLKQLRDAEATVEAVLSAMDECSWVHLACHATQDVEDPTESAFFLSDGKLSLAKLTKKPLKHASLAFLSACQTARGHQKSPEEAIHLAAGMIMSGYPTVIATMWSIKDKHAPLVAEHVYAGLLEDGVPDTTRTARALHRAVAKLREVAGVGLYEEWAPFIHIGI